VTPPAWLAELHRQWARARGLSLEPAARGFRRDWPDLLDAAGLRTAAERSQAEREARELAAAGRLRLLTHRYRTYLLEKVEVPPTAEDWLVRACGGVPAREAHGRARAVVATAAARGHPRWPESWTQLCTALDAAFRSGENLPPFFWKDPTALAHTLDVLHGLTARAWPPGTLVREVSHTLTADSKALEKSPRLWEAALERLFGGETSLAALGILDRQSHARLHGPLALHFPDGTTQDFVHLRGEFTLSLDDLQRAVRATTTAQRMLSIENARTTFRQAAAVNPGDTLLLATAFPAEATRRLLALLPADLPHFHFGDTDPSGYAILRALREPGMRPVQPFLMTWQDREASPPLTERDRRLLATLIGDPLLGDCRESLQAIAQAGRKGRFEQEGCGTPVHSAWPFWPTATDRPRGGPMAP
jgi:hypothetical protein